MFYATVTDPIAAMGIAHTVGHWHVNIIATALFHSVFNLDFGYSSKKIRKTQNEHLNIICQNFNSQ